MKPVLQHRRVSRESSDRSGNDSISSGPYRSSTLSPIRMGPITPRSSLSPLLGRGGFRLSPKHKSEQTFWILVSMIFLIIIIIWIYTQYQFIPSTSNSNNFNTKAVFPYQHSFISSSDTELLSQTLYTQCHYAYSHNSSNIGDIYLSIPNLETDNLPFLQFLTFSDYGIIKQKNKENQNENINIKSLLQLINVMNSHLKYNTHFVISAGDHFYDNNVNYARHYRWNAMFDNFMKNKVFLAALGNKDWVNTSNKMDIDNVNAQIDRTYWSSNWCLPRLYYTVRFVFKNELTETLSFSVRFIALDTTSYLKTRYNKFEYLSEQYQWLYNILETNKNDDWIIVFGHHPFESVPSKTKQRKSNLRKFDRKYTFKQLQNNKVWKKKMSEILKLLLRYDNVMGYISGHHHVWRVCNIFDKNGKMKLLSIVTGSTGRHDHHFKEGLPIHMIAGGEQETFGKITINRDLLRVQIIDKHNHTLFSDVYHKYKK